MGVVVGWGVGSGSVPCLQLSTSNRQARDGGCENCPLGRPKNAKKTAKNPIFTKKIIVHWSIGDRIEIG